METRADNEQATWTAPQCPFSVSYSLRVLDDIRLAVMDAFFSLPRGGAEIGGLLLGTYDRRQVVITAYAPLDVEHAFGPSFTLSPRDEAKLSDLLRRHDGQVVGWYHSHTRSEIFLSEADQEVHRRFFPHAWQLALVLKPHTFNPMRAGFFFREEGGAIHAEASYQDFPLLALPLRAVPPLQPPVEEPRYRVEPASDGPVITIDTAPLPAEPAPKPVLVAAPVPVPDIPQFARVQPPSSRRAWVVTLCVLLAVALGAWTYQTRAFWQHGWTGVVRAKSTSPPVSARYVGLSVREQDTELHIRWDRNSPAVRSAVSAVLTIADGSDSRTVNLDQEHLHSGSVIYVRKAGRVDVAMVLQQPDGPPVREATQFVGAAGPSVAEDPALLQRVGELTVQNDKLRTDVLRQMERARKAEKALEEIRKESQSKRLTNQLPDIAK